MKYILLSIILFQLFGATTKDAIILDLPIGKFPHSNFRDVTWTNNYQEAKIADNNPDTYDLFRKEDCIEFQLTKEDGQVPHEVRGVFIVNGTFNGEMRSENFSRIRKARVVITRRRITTEEVYNLADTIRCQKLDFGTTYWIGHRDKIQIQILDTYNGESDKVGLSEIYLDLGHRG